MQHLGANKTERSIQRIGKCIGQIDEILTCYDQQNEVPIPSVHHSIPSSNSDRDLMIRELPETDVFSVKPGRQHRNFANFTCNTMKKVNKKKMREWMNKQLKILVEVLAMQT